MDHETNGRARRLFDGIAPRYDLPARLLSLFQYGRWRRYLVSRLDLKPSSVMLDLCTGTAGVALDVARAYGCRVIGVDLSPRMLEQARRNIRSLDMEPRLALLLGRAESLPFQDSRFDAVCFTYLLRYVDDPESTLREIVRVLKPGGQMASLEFGVPHHAVARCLWYGYTRGVLPRGASIFSPEWRKVGAFLGPSISEFYRRYSVEHLSRMWVNAGIPDVRVRRLTLGGAVVMWGTRSGERAPGIR